VVSNAHSLHYDPDYFPSASTFNPERFLDPATAANAKSNMWTFYRGPRACLGQNLAIDELRIILLETIRDYDFECVGLQPNVKQWAPWSDLDKTFGDICFQKMGLGAQVRDGMMMRVKKVEKN
jgi:cytochrome P450